MDPIQAKSRTDATGGTRAGKKASETSGRGNLQGVTLPAMPLKLPDTVGRLEGNAPSFGASKTLAEISRQPAEFNGGDFHRLLAQLREKPEAGEKVKGLLAEAIKDPSLIPFLLTACDAQLRIKRDESSDAFRGQVIDLLIQAGNSLAGGTRSQDEAFRQIKKMPLDDVELLAVRFGGFRGKANFLAELRDDLPLRGLFRSAFGDGPLSWASRCNRIREKYETLCMLVDHGLLIDEVVTLVGYGGPVNGRILKRIYEAVKAEKLALSENAQKALWKFVRSDRGTNREKTVAMDILLAEQICESVQLELARCLTRLPDEVPVRRAQDRICMFMCAEVEKGRACIDELRDAVRHAGKRGIGSCLVDPKLVDLDRKKGPVDYGQEIVWSYKYAVNNGEVSFFIPRGIDDVAAADALNRYARSYGVPIRLHFVQPVDPDWGPFLSAGLTKKAREVAINLSAGSEKGEWPTHHRARGIAVMLHYCRLNEAGLEKQIAWSRGDVPDSRYGWGCGFGFIGRKFVLASNWSDLHVAKLRSYDPFTGLRWRKDTIVSISSLCDFESSTPAHPAKPHQVRDKETDTRL